MTPRSQLVSVDAGSSISHCLTLMRDHGIRHLLVMDHNDTELLGVVSIKASDQVTASIVHCSRRAAGHASCGHRVLGTHHVHASLVVFIATL